MNGQSKFLVASSAVKSDDYFVERVKAAAAIHGCAMYEQRLYAVAAACADHIDIGDENAYVNSDRVTDDEIWAAVTQFPADAM